MSRLDCVVLAGAPADDDLRKAYDVAWRAEVPVAGKRMIDWVIEALRSSDRVGRIIAVAGFQCGADETLEPGGTFLTNVMLGAQAAGGDGLIMIASSDIPLAEGPAYSDLIDKAIDADADFIYPAIRQEHCLEMYPQFKRTYLRLRDGTFTGGNAVVVNKSFLLKSRDRIEDFYQARKQPMRLASMIGCGVLVRAVIAHKVWPGAIGISEAETAAGKVMGGRLKAVISTFPEIGEDLDSLEDIAAADEILKRRNIGG